MIIKDKAGPSKSNQERKALSSIQPPPNTAKSSRATPIAVASSTRPGRILRIYRPIKMAMGIVAPTVEVAHGLCRMALTTTKPSTAIKIIIMANTPIMATAPPKGPSSSRAIWPSERPSRLIEQNRITKSCTQPPRTAPINIHKVPGRKPNWAASVGPIKGPGPAIAAK